jgi:hypothetical protein
MTSSILSSRSMFLAASRHRVHYCITAWLIHWARASGSLALTAHPLSILPASGQQVAAGSGSKAVYGVIPHQLAPREVSGELIGEVQVVDDMHTRKALMAKRADGFIGLPGGDCVAIVFCRVRALTRWQWMLTRFTPC